jgi:alkylation response protein AidB-like acyl-CoA dehydrogenase
VIEGPAGATRDGSAADLQEFRAEVAAWLSQRFPLRDPDRDDDRVDIISRAPDGHRALIVGAIELQRGLASAGFAGLALPVEYGGRGLTKAHAEVLDEELARFDTPSLRPLSIGMNLAAGTLLAAGSEEQKRRYLPPLVRATEIWCQLFSEPDAGSDLVSLRTRAIRDGDGWVLEGQKVWSSFASDADFGLFLAKTAPEAERPQSAITMFILPMHDPGVVVRPLVDMAGGHHFNEVFVSGTRVGPDDVIGEVNEGWRVANSTLGGERSGYMGGSGGGRRQRQLTALAARHGRRADPIARQHIVRAVSAERILEWLRDRYVSGALAGGHPAAGSMLKLAAGTLEQEVAELGAVLAGATAQAWTCDDRDGDVVHHALAASRQATIAGGTHQIQRNLLGERVLGLPRG